jgi:thiol-disulfide isomerase/thioredoxin
MKNHLLYILIFSCLFRCYSQTAPDFTFTDTDGGNWNLYTELEKGKTVLLDFFYTSCVPCQTLTPEIVQLNIDYGLGNEDLVVFGISDRDNNEAIEEFNHDLGVNYPSCGSEGGGDTITSLYMSWFSFIGWPTYAVVCSDKSIIWGLASSEGLTEIREAIDNCPVWTNITTKQLNSNYQVFPLPASDQLFLKTEITDLTEISLFNSISGAKVFYTQKELSSELFSISLADLDSGMYILYLKSANAHFVFKIPIIK